MKRPTSTWTLPDSESDLSEPAESDNPPSTLLSPRPCLEMIGDESKYHDATSEDEHYGFEDGKFELDAPLETNGHAASQANQREQHHGL